MLNDKEFKILKKYRNRAPVAEEDRLILDEYASIGYVNLGCDMRTESMTAVLNDRGKKLIKSEEISRSPVRSFLRTYVSCLY